MPETTTTTTAEPETEKPTKTKTKSTTEFKARIKHKVLKSVVDALATIVDEFKLRVHPSGIGIVAVDPAHVAMVDLALDGKAFDEYKAGELELGIDLDKLKEILKLATADDVLGLEFKPDQNRLVFKVGNITRRMSLTDTSGIPEPKIPTLNLPNSVTVRASEIHFGVKGAESVSDHISLVSDSTAFELNAEGDTDSVSLRLTKNQLVKLKADERTKSLFSLDYFTSLVKACEPDAELTLLLGNDYPVKVEFGFAGGHGHITYLLAPRIESD